MASTVRGYAAHVRLYLGPYLGEVLLTEITVGQVQAMFGVPHRSRTGDLIGFSWKGTGTSAGKSEAIHS